MPRPITNPLVCLAGLALAAMATAQTSPNPRPWSFTPPVRPAVPDVADARWPSNPVDRFLLARLERGGLPPAADADRRTLLRRLGLDLLGLPPTPAEVAAFARDDDAGAYEHLVDRLLASPHFGERMAMYWLDLVRYADTVGCHGDRPMSVFPYRDWVIAAFNDNLPFDRFTREQLAGDLLPDAGLPQRVASTYNRLNMKTNEGGAQDAEYRAKYAADRVRTTSMAWMGTTLGCAECHDHKFDPFTARDFYRFAAFFADLDQQGYYTDANWPPFIAVPDQRQRDRLAAIDARIAAIEAELATTTPAIAADERRWTTAARAELASPPPEFGPWRVAGPFRGGSLRDAYERAYPPEHAADGVTWSERPEWVDGTIHQLTGDNSATYVARTIDSATSRRMLLGLGSDDSLKVWLNGREVLAREVSRGVAPDQELLGVELAAGRNDLLLKVVNGGGGYGFYFAVKQIGPPPAVAAVLRVEPAERTDAQRELLAAHYRSIAPRLDDARARLEVARAERIAFAAAIPTTLVSRSVEPRPTRILPRGNWLDQHGDIVEPGVPQSLPQIDSGGRRATRLDLARWLTARDNPLTARVFVNRLWTMFFGTGLVKTLDDFGARGEEPRHRELLDWLAVEFVDSGWDVKHVVRLLVTSHAYRLSSVVDRAQRELDPDNRLHARQSRFRLAAEMVRDNALAISGLLVPTIGGPSVKPYQPAGYWRELNFPKRTYVADVGDAQHRRGLYTHWQRSFLHPSLVAFDAPSREECTVERWRSNTPQQALVLLNDPTYVEAARVFAAWVVAEGGRDFDARLRWAFDRALARAPSAHESETLAALFAARVAHYAAEPQAARALARVGQAPVVHGSDPVLLASWTAVTRVLLNLHETITRP